jgi:hypothetical protein
MSDYSDRRYYKTDSVFLDIKKTRKSVLGGAPKSPTSMNNPVFTLRAQSRNNEAILLVKLPLTQETDFQAP